MKPPLSLPALSPLVLAGSIAALLSSSPRVAAVDGTWVRPVGSGNGTYSDTTNWLDGIVASGTDGTAIFNYDPASDLDGGLFFDVPQTLGNVVFNDIDGFGFATFGFNNPGGGAQVLTFDLSAVGAIPTVSVGQLLNSQNAGKKSVINSTLAGTDGLRKNGPGLLGLRGPNNTISGSFVIEGGSLEVRDNFRSITSLAITGGGSVNMEFNTTPNSTDRFATTAPLILGGPGGSGTIFNTVAAATTQHSQTFAGVTVNAGANQIVAVTGTNQNMNYALGVVTHNEGGALNFGKPTAAGNAGFVVLNPSGLLGSWATFANNDWATVSANLVSAFSAYNNDAWAPGNQTNITRSQALDNATTETLRFNTGHASVVTLSGANTLTSGGIISAQQSPRITGGTLTSGDANGDLYIHSQSTGNLGLTLETTITDNGATPVRIVKAGTGGLTIAGDNSQTGGLILGAGTILMGVGPSGGAAGSVGGPITVSANNTTTGLYSPNGALAFNRAGTYTIANDINATLNAGGFVAQFSPGVLVVPKAMKLGGLNAQQGTIRLNFNAPTAPVSQLIDSSFTTGPVTIHTARLVLRSGSLEVLGKDGANTLQSFALTDVQGRSKIVLTPGAGGTVALDLGSINRGNNSTDAAGTLAVTLVPGSRLLMTSGLANTLLSVNGVAYATINGTDWAAKDATNTEVVPGSSLPGFYETTTSGTIGAGNADLAVDDPIISSSQTTNSLRISKSTGPSTITLEGSGTDLGLGGLLVSSTAGANNASIGGGESGTGSIRSLNTGDRDLPIIHNGSGILSINVPIINPTANATHLVKAGTGDVVLNAANTMTGRVTVTEGRLIAAGTSTLGSAAARTNNVHIRNGELVVQDNAQVFAGGFFAIGQRIGDNAKLTVKDSGVVDVAADFNVGDVNAKGTLAVSGTSTLTLRRLFVGKFGYAEGIVDQTGGTVQAGNTPAGDWQIGGTGAGDTAAVGTYNLSEGTFDTGNQNFQVGTFGTGTINQTGGTYRGTGFIAIGRFHSGVGTWNISGGILDATNTLSPGVTPAPKDFLIIAEAGKGDLNVSGMALVTARNLSLGHGGGFGTVTQSGGTVDLLATAPIGAVQAGIVFGQGAAPNPAFPTFGGLYNLNGGTLRTFGIAKATGSLGNAVVNFNGGKLQATGANPTLLTNLDEANVGAGGFILDTNGFEVGIPQSLTHTGASPDGGLTKQGEGIASLSGFNTYDGPTTVQAGTLRIDFGGGVTSNVAVNDTSILEVAGSIIGNIIVGSDATLKGAGSIDGAVTVNGLFQPGASPGILTLGNDPLTLVNGSASAFELGGRFTGEFDRVVGIDQLTLDGSVSVALFGGFQPVNGDSFDLFDFNSINATTFDLGSELVLPPLDPGLFWDTGTFVSTGTLVVVPEPTAALALLAASSLLLGGRRFRNGRRVTRA